MGLSKERYQERLEKGLCPTCGARRDEETVQCGKCKEKWAKNKKAHYARRKQMGLCRTCPAKIAEGTLCSECLRNMGEQTRLLHAGRRSRGECMWCVNPRTVRRFCERCWFDSIALRVLGSKSFGAELRALYADQGGRCYYTGEILSPGTNTALDHQTPTSAGGSSEIKNLKWTTIRVNRVKNDLSHKEFVQLCEIISNKFGLI